MVQIAILGFGTVGSGVAHVVDANAEAIADQKDRARRRMNPVARNLLLGDVVFLAACIWLEKMGVLSSELNNITALIGAAIIPIALYFQFVKKDGGSAKRLK